MRAALAIACAFGLGAVACNGCGGCSKDDAVVSVDGATPPAPSVVAEALPRCRADAARFAIPGEDPVVGDVAIGPAGLLVGLVRRDHDKRVGSVMRTSLDLEGGRVIDLGPAVGDDPAPSPRWNGTNAFAAITARKANDVGPSALRDLRLFALDEAGAPRLDGSVIQQADESTAFDLAWPEGAGPALVVWDEDAPPSGDGSITSIRGFVKIQSLAQGSKPRVASPEASDAESPRLVSRPGGFWLAWLARRAEEAPAPSLEGPGERRAYRWVEIVALDAKGEAVSSVRRVSPEKGRAVSFELAHAQGGQDLVVMVQDEAAYAEGLGGRIFRYSVNGDRIDGREIVDGGVGHALADLVPVPSDLVPGNGARWLAWTDIAEHTHLTPLADIKVDAGSDTVEPALDSARILAAKPPDALYALVESAGRPELRRFLCR